MNTSRHSVGQRRTLGIWLATALVVVLAGCASSSRSDGDNDGYGNVRRSGALPVTHNALESVNLIELMDPTATVEKEYTTRPTEKTAEKPKPWGELPYAVRYDLIFARFSTLAPTTTDTPKAHRNLVQNRIIAASERRCGRFFQFLKKDNSDMNFGFGLANVFLSTAAAIVPGIEAARNLAGSSAIVAGARAEYNNEYFSNLAVSVITRGIEEKRRDTRLKLRTSQSQDYATYDIAAAVADAVQYDASCNIVHGLEQANEAIQRLNEPGRDAMMRSLLKDRVNRALVSDDVDSLKKLQASLTAINIDAVPLLMGTIQPMGSGVSAGISQSTAAATPTDVIAGAAKTLNRLRNHIEGLASQSVLALDGLPKSADPVAVTALREAINTSITGLQKDIAEDFVDDPKVSCAKEANNVAVKLSAGQIGVQLARINKKDLQKEEDKLEDAKKMVVALAQKLDRYEKLAGEFAAAKSKELATRLVDVTDLPKITSEIQLKWKATEVTVRLLGMSRCNAA